MKMIGLIGGVVLCISREMKMKRVMVCRYRIRIREISNGAEILPSLCINPIDTKKESIADLVGESFSVMTINESYDREDSFYIYEHEPLADYKLKILEIDSDKAHIKCSGTLVVDGYKEPPIKEKFEIDSWIPVIESVEDWEKFGL